MDLVSFLTQRSVIVALALAGATLVMLASMRRDGRTATPPGMSRLLVVTGYVMTGVSIILFIVAGFLSGR